MNKLPNILATLALVLLVLGGLAITSAPAQAFPCNIPPCVCLGCDCNNGGSCSGYVCLSSCQCKFYVLYYYCIYSFGPGGSTGSA
jgi:hypothetical protein